MIDIRAEGSPAFHLRATVQFYEKGKPSSQAHYDLKWRSRGRWREEIYVGNLQQLRIADGDKLWERRNLPYFTPDVEQIEKVMEFPQHIRLLGNELPSAVEAKEVNGIQARCFEVKDGHFQIKRVCLLRDSDFPVRVDYARGNGGGGFRYEDPISFGKYKYPRVIESFDKMPILKFRIEELTAMETADSDSFIVPPDARSYRWCPNPTPAEPMQERALIPPEIESRIKGQRAVIYGVIGTDGQWHDLALVQSSAKVSESVWFGLVRSFRFRPAHCGGTPIETERLTKFSIESR